MAEQHLMTVDFVGHPVSILDYAGKRWLTAEQVGRCLGYDETNVRIGIGKLYSRHADEFTDADTFVVNLATNSRGNPNMRIFSATGCIKLGFFANTPKAKQFRAWAAVALEAQSAPAIPPAPAVAALPGLKVTRRKERIALEMFVAGEDTKTIGKAIGIARGTVSQVLHGKYQFSFGAGAPECSAELIAAVAARHLAVEQVRLAMLQERAAQRYLSTANNQALANALEQVGRHLQQAPSLALAAQLGGEAS